MMWQYKLSHIVMVTGVCEGGKVGVLYSHRYMYGDNTTYLSHVLCYMNN